MNPCDQTAEAAPLYSHGICPRLIRDMAIHNLPISWVTKNVEAMATRYLKRWSGLARNATTHRLYLPKTSGGLHLPSFSSIYKKTRCDLTASQMCSQDPPIRLIASWQTVSESKSIKAVFKLHQEVVEVMKDDPGVSHGQFINSVKQRVTATDDSWHLEDCRVRAVQGNLSRQFADQASTIWAQALWELPEKAMKFTLNAVQDTLPTQRKPPPMEKSAFSQLPPLL